MKKLSVFITVLLLAGLASCKKTSTTSAAESTSETVNLSVNASESYRYALPALTGSDSYAIESGSARSANVSIEQDASGSAFVYVPVQSTGTSTDQVVISNTSNQSNNSGGCGQHHEGHGGNCGNKSGNRHHGGHHGHNCQNNNSSRHTITFNITVNGNQN